MALYRDEGIVLRTHKLGEADRIITLLTRGRGRVRAVAKGVRRTTSKFGARLEPFMYVDLQLHEGRSLDVITQAETLRPYAKDLCRDYQAYTTASAMVEMAERLTEVEREPATQQFWLLVAALKSLADREHAADLVLIAYMLRAMAVAGYAPSFVDCARCGEPGPHRALAVALGGAVCPACRPPGALAPTPATMETLAGLLAGEWDVAEAADARTRSDASGIAAAYSQWHLERSMRTLRLVDRTGAAPAPVTRQG